MTSQEPPDGGKGHMAGIYQPPGMNNFLCGSAGWSGDAVLKLQWCPWLTQHYSMGWQDGWQHQALAGHFCLLSSGGDVKN